MRTPTTRPLLALAACTLLFVSAACSDDDGGSAGSDGVPDTQAPAEDEGVAAALLLQPTELPIGWDASDAGFAAVEQALINRAESVPTCEEVRVSTADTGRDRAGVSYTNGLEGEVAMSVAIYPNPRAAATRFEEATGDAAATCFADLMTAVAGVQMLSTNMEPFDGGGDDGRRMTVAGDGTIIESTWVLVDRAVITWSESGPTAMDLDEALNELITKVGEELSS